MRLATSSSPVLFPDSRRYLAKAIPDSEACFYAGEGHVSLIVNHTVEILSVLAER